MLGAQGVERHLPSQAGRPSPSPGDPFLSLVDGGHEDGVQQPCRKQRVPWKEHAKGTGMSGLTEKPGFP